MFDEVWKFSGSAMRRVNSQEEHVGAMNRVLSKVKRQNDPELLSITTTGKEKRALGKVRTRVLFVLKDGKELTGLHTTTWVWERVDTSREANWFLVRDGVADVPTSTNSASRQ